MQLARAVRILERLRDGEDPETGRPLTTGPAQEPDVVRALYTVLAALPAEREEEIAEREVPTLRPQPSRKGQPWTDSEDAHLGAAFDSGESIAKLARGFERSVAAIRLRLVKLGRISAEEAPASRSRRLTSPAADEPSGPSRNGAPSSLDLEHTAVSG